MDTYHARRTHRHRSGRQADRDGRRLAGAGDRRGVMIVTREAATPRAQRGATVPSGLRQRRLGVGRPPPENRREDRRGPTGKAASPRDKARRHEMIGRQAARSIDGFRRRGAGNTVQLPSTCSSQRARSQITWTTRPRSRRNHRRRGQQSDHPDAHVSAREVLRHPSHANAGSVTTSVVKNRHGYFWKRGPEAGAQDGRGVRDVFQTARAKTDMRTAAYIVAINRVATVTKMRDARNILVPPLGESRGCSPKGKSS